MVEQIFTYVIAPIVTVICTSLGTTWFNKRKSRAEAIALEDTNRASELQNTQEAIKIWRELAETFQQKLSERESSMTDLKTQLDIITAQNKELLTKVDVLEKDYFKLLRNYNELKNSLK